MPPRKKKKYDYGTMHNIGMDMSDFYSIDLVKPKTKSWKKKRYGIVDNLKNKK